MNVFDAIKGTILSVPKDISSGFKALTTRDSPTSPPGGAVGTAIPSSPSRVLRTFQHGQHVDLNAGAELLTKFQNSWSEIHQLSEENANKAKLVDVQVNDLFVHLEREKEAVNLFLQEISALPYLLQSLQATTDNIDHLEGSFEAVESELVKLEDMCERNELHRNMKHHQYQLSAYRQRSSVELEQAKVRMAKNHAIKVQKYEYHLQKSLRQKQHVFEATFKAEMQHYKKYGKTTRKYPMKQSPSSDADLSGFVPDPEGHDSEVLDQFLHVAVPDDLHVDADEVMARTDPPETPTSSQDDHQDTPTSSKDDQQVELPHTPTSFKDDHQVELPQTPTSSKDGHQVELPHTPIISKDDHQVELPHTLSSSQDDDQEGIVLPQMETNDTKKLISDKDSPESSDTTEDLGLSTEPSQVEPTNTVITS